jgi:hypothetical protein
MVALILADAVLSRGMGCKFLLISHETCLFFQTGDQNWKSGPCGPQ